MNSGSTRKPESTLSPRKTPLLLLLAALGLLSGCNLPSAALNPATSTLISARQTQAAGTYPSPTPIFREEPGTFQTPPSLTTPEPVPPQLPVFTPTPTLDMPVPEGMRLYYS